MLTLETLDQFLRDELVQKKSEGYDVSSVEAKYAEMDQKSVEALKALFDALDVCPMRSDFPYAEPSDWAQIKADWLKAPQDIPVKLSEDALYDKVYGGWLGRCVGCMLGKPVEKLTREQIEVWLNLADAYPLCNYVPPLPESVTDVPDWLVERLTLIDNWTKARRRQEDWRPETLLGRINRSVRDDDIDYTIMRLDLVEDYGLNFTTMDVAEAMIYQTPYRRLYSAERATYRNLLSGIFPPRSNTYLNPGREIMGAMTRGDMWGYIAPGRPAMAVDMAYRDAALTHVKNGIYGELFSTAMISTALATVDIDQIVEAGLSVIPQKSRLAEAVRDTLVWSGEYEHWEDAWRNIMAQYGHYHWAHTIPNASLILLGLIYGRGDFEKSIAITVMAGLDTDSTAATVGSLLGIMTGARALPAKWVEPLNDRIESYVVGYSDISIVELARRTMVITKAVLER